MNTILIDSSAWIEYFRGSHDFLFINDLIDNNLISTNDIVLTELLPSMVRKKEHKLIELMRGIFKYEINIDWKELQNYQLKNLQKGNNNVPITDLLIAQNCIQNGLTLVSRDKHFDLMSKYLPVKLFNIKRK